MRFWPSDLGEALVSAYQKMNLEGLWRPDLRGRIEQGIQQVADGYQSKIVVLNEACKHFQQVNPHVVWIINIVYYSFASNELGLAGLLFGNQRGPCHSDGGCKVLSIQ